MKRGWLLLPLALLALPGAARASVAPLYVAAHQHAGSAVPNPQRFSAIVGYPGQCVKGVPCWTYTKGTRSRTSTFPESWYLHAGTTRVQDRVYHLYVMDPRSKGWQQHVAAACGQHCFLDGMGPSSLNRDVPKVAWTAQQWVAASALVVKAVVAAGKQVLPNSMGANAKVDEPLIAAAGRASTEAFNTRNAQALLTMGSVWVQEIGDCLSKYAAYQTYRGTGDHFSCYEWGHLPWDTSWLP